MTITLLSVHFYKQILNIFSPLEIPERIPGPLKIPDPLVFDTNGNPG